MRKYAAILSRIEDAVWFRRGGSCVRPEPVEGCLSSVASAKEGPPATQTNVGVRFIEPAKSDNVGASFMVAREDKRTFKPSNPVPEPSNFLTLIPNP